MLGRSGETLWRIVLPIWTGKLPPNMLPLECSTAAEGRVGDAQRRVAQIAAVDDRAATGVEDRRWS